jgi:hypothetical protein
MIIMAPGDFSGTIAGASKNNDHARLRPKGTMVWRHHQGRCSISRLFHMLLVSWMDGKIHWRIRRGILLRFRIHNHYCQSPCFEDQSLYDGLAAEPPLPARERTRATDHDVAHAVLPGKMQDGIDHVFALEGKNQGTQSIGEGKGIGQVALSGGVDHRWFLTRSLNVDRVPVTVEAPGQA